MSGWTEQERQASTDVSNGTLNLAPANGAAATPSGAVSHASVGLKLKAAREARGMTVDEVSRALKLSTRQVEALESDDWSHLPGKTIIRGFVRNYARLVGVDGSALMGAMEAADLPKSPELTVTVGTPVNLPQEGKVDGKDTFRVIMGLLVLTLAVLAYFFTSPEVWKSTYHALIAVTHSGEPAHDAGAAKAEAEAAAPTSSEENAVRPPAAAPMTQDSAEIKAEVSATTPASLPAEAPAAASVLLFRFEQPSWVEVRDRSGQVIFSQKNAAGTEKEVSGQPPYAIVIGNAGHVTLQYKGQPVDLSKRSREDVARLTLE